MHQTTSSSFNGKIGNYAAGGIRVEQVCEMPDKNKGQIIKRILCILTL